MKKMGIFSLLFFSVVLLFPNTIANIIEQKGQILVIDKGKVDGVAVGLKGIIRAVYKDPSGEYYVNIGLFSVKKVMERTAEIFVESLGIGFKLEDARYVVFDETLKPPSEGGEATGQKSVKTSVEDLLDQGEQLMTAGKYQQAIEVFQRVLQQDSGNLIAKERISELQRKMDEGERSGKFKEYIRKSDSYYQKRDIKSAFLYLAEAYKVYPEGREEIKKRLTVMDREYPQDFSRVVNEKMQEIGDMQKIVAELSQREEKEEKVVKAGTNKAEREEAGVVEEPFLREIRSKAKSIAKNENGYWEATFLDDIVMVYLPEGDFTVGSAAEDGDDDEHPAHKVFIKGYWISKYEITFDEYDRFCRETKAELALDEGWGRGGCPVINVSWEDARRFCNWLSRKTGLSFRLPTEAEWEKAASDYYPWGTASPNKKLCNYNKVLGKTAPVGSYPNGASKFGIMDLAGNVWEWVNDWYDPAYYQRSETRNPQGPAEGTEKCVRGGSWDDNDYIVRSANRSSENPTSRLNKIGFRITLTTR